MTKEDSRKWQSSTRRDIVVSFHTCVVFGAPPKNLSCPLRWSFLTLLVWVPSLFSFLLLNGQQRTVIPQHPIKVAK
ncbi:rCG63417 [Rattus norvegicus]|uniref:RCG63417 n=1 Tax=Rattus norvegicus TaxID=10116 RepID=A6IKX8_RAT|nr:rCG63417 [Rattus norvegicus]